MSEIKALYNLHKMASNFRSDVYKRDEVDYLLEIADNIQAEVDSLFMALPLDADGAPIHVGDKVECNANGYEGTFTVFTIGDDTVVGNHDIEWIRDNPSKWFHVASFCHHVKPRTIEDVLKELACDVRKEWIENAPLAKHVYSEYADEIRELMKEGGDD